MSARPAAVPAALVTALLLALLGAGVATAAPALAVDDPSRPDAQVTHGPSCHPGGVVLEVTAGTAPYSVRLATTRQPEGEDEAVLEPGGTVRLSTGDVAWGETIDSRLEYTALDDSGVVYTDELEDYSFTRPTEEDCAAITLPPSPATTPAAPSAAPPSIPAVEAGAPGMGQPPVQTGGDVLPPPAGTTDEAEPADTAGSPDPGAAEPTTEAGPARGPMAARVAPAAQTRGVTSWPLFFAALSLLATGGALGSVAVRRWTDRRGGLRTGSGSARFGAR